MCWEPTPHSCWQSTGLTVGASDLQAWANHPHAVVPAPLRGHLEYLKERATIRRYLDSLKERGGEAGYPPGHARLDDSDDPRPRAVAWLRHLAATRGAQ